MTDIKIFTENIEPAAQQIIADISANPLFDGTKIRIMPDVHAAGNIVVGFTCPIGTRLNPEHIGGDIGCGIDIALFDRVLPPEHYPLFEQRIRNAVPMGKDLCQHRTFDVKDFCRFVRREMSKAQQSSDGLVHEMPFSKEDDIAEWCRTLNMDEKTFYKSMGTLGGGNHFIELDYNAEKQLMGATVHTGSRNVGQKVCRKWTRKAIATGGYLSGTLLQGYLTDMVICQAYARYNRQVILGQIADIYRKMCKGKVTQVITTVHNYLDFQDMIIRKGAIRSYQDEPMVIPFNMRDGLAICTGKSNADWNCSAPHGSGRALSRNKAKELLTLSDYQDAMRAIYSTSVNLSTIDESPMAYKPTAEIIALLDPTCHIDYLMQPVINLKSSQGEE